jgi:predicted ArsR family transcriptional regulator
VDETALDPVSGIAALDHPISRATYQLVVDRDWVSRDAAASALDLSRSVAAFHLDKLVDAGLLDVRYERTSGRTGPGAGRPAKLYGRAAREISVSLPPRRYDLAGSLLADAVSRAEAANIPVKQALAEVARRNGQDAAGQAPSGARSREAVMEILRQRGYEPRKRGREIALLNCPFHALAEQHRDLVCEMNLELLTGLLEAVTGAKLSARLDPEPGYCCVRLAPASTKTT